MSLQNLLSEVKKRDQEEQENRALSDSDGDEPRIVFDWATTASHIEDGQHDRHSQDPSTSTGLLGQADSGSHEGKGTANSNSSMAMFVRLGAKEFIPGAAKLPALPGLDEPSESVPTAIQPGALEFIPGVVRINAAFSQHDHHHHHQHLQHAVQHHHHHDSAHFHHHHLHHQQQQSSDYGYGYPAYPTTAHHHHHHHHQAYSAHSPYYAPQHHHYYQEQAHAYPPSAEYPSSYYSHPASTSELYYGHHHHHHHHQMYSHHHHQHQHHHHHAYTASPYAAHPHHAAYYPPSHNPYYPIYGPEHQHHHHHHHHHSGYANPYGSSYPPSTTPTPPNSSASLLSSVGPHNHHHHHHHMAHHYPQHAMPKPIPVGSAAGAGGMIVSNIAPGTEVPLCFPVPEAINQAARDCIRKINLSRVIWLGNHKYNLHATLPKEAGLLTVPICTPELYKEFINNDQRNTEAVLLKELQLGKQVRTCKLFVGQGPLVPNTDLFYHMIVTVAGVSPVSVRILNSANPVKVLQSTGHRPVTKPPLVLVEVLEADAWRVISSLHRRVIIDQCGFHVAVTKDQCVALHNYTKMLSSNPTIRFQHRPYTAVTCVRASPKAHPKSGTPLYDNEYNPLCGCTECTQTFNSCHLMNHFIQQFQNNFSPDYTSPSFLFREYLTDKIALHPERNPHPLFFMKTHAYLDKSNLHEDDLRMYSDVADPWVKKCNLNAEHFWPQFRGQPISELDGCCKKVLISKGPRTTPSGLMTTIDGTTIGPDGLPARPHREHHVSGQQQQQQPSAYQPYPLQHHHHHHHHHHLQQHHHYGYPHEYLQQQQQPEQAPRRSGAHVHVSSSAYMHQIRESILKGDGKKKHSNNNNNNHNHHNTHNDDVNIVDEFNTQPHQQVHRNEDDDDDQEETNVATTNYRTVPYYGVGPNPHYAYLAQHGQGQAAPGNGPPTDPAVGVNTGGGDNNNENDGADCQINE